MIPAHHFLPRVPSNCCEASAKKSRSTTSCPILECSLSTSAALTRSGTEPRRVNAVAMFSIAARFQVPICVASHTCFACVAGNRCTPYFLDSSASVISSRIASSATLASNSPSHRYCVSTAGQRDEWFFRFFTSDHFFHHAIHLTTGPNCRDHL